MNDTPPDFSPAFRAHLVQWCDAERGRRSALALACGVRRSEVSEWLAGRHKPGHAQTLRILAYAGEGWRESVFPKDGGSTTKPQRSQAQERAPRT